MDRLSPELQEKFREFRKAYELALVWLADAGGTAEQKAWDAWRSALRAVPITEMEEDLFRSMFNEESSK